MQRTNRYFAMNPDAVVLTSPCVKRKGSKNMSCLNECEAESLLCKTKATTYFIEYKCKTQQTKCQKTCWKYGHQNRYKDHNDVDRRRNEELSVQDLWRFFYNVCEWPEAGNSEEYSELRKWSKTEIFAK